MGATAGDAFPEGFIAGVAHFNSGRFFEAHESFEDLLDAVESDARWELLVALIQVAVGYHKGQHGHPGCARMLRLGLEKLGDAGATAFGVDVAALRRRIAADLAAIDGEADIAAHLGADPPRVRLVASTSG